MLIYNGIIIELDAVVALTLEYVGDDVVVDRHQENIVVLIVALLDIESFEIVVLVVQLEHIVVPRQQGTVEDPDDIADAADVVDPVMVLLMVALVPNIVIVPVAGNHDTCELVYKSKNIYEKKTHF